MLTSLMVPLDGSIFAEHALPAAIDLARRTGATLHLVRVHQPPVLPSPDAPVIVDVDWVESLRAEELAYLDRVAASHVEPTGLGFVKRLVNGFPADALSAYVQEVGIGMIVMTTHGRGGISRFWLGSVADALVRQSRTPVLLIRPREVEPADERPPLLRHILVPTDGSHLSYTVLEPALALGALSGARFTILRVLAPLPSLAWTLNMGAEDEQLIEERTHALNALERIAEPIRARGVAIECAVLVHGVPAQAILDYTASHAVDAITLATRGRSGWARVAMGSVADKVMRGGLVPVLLFRPPAYGTTQESRDMAIPEQTAARGAAEFAHNSSARGGPERVGRIATRSG
jgi:nucleotide-binding universal stress UspA family protein